MGEKGVGVGGASVELIGVQEGEARGDDRVGEDYTRQE